ncbi:ATP-binding cassette domain-containing protein [Mycobacterium sp. 1423905.2]|uniref:ATP-binding cassette domain-containing protein n=1 Tax=Mycobacterium sp. 1423905.2 TaxID=1856859 RepID=UPI0007FD224E|nr:ATP-binding cassette domain-containing protein [Mycobacterium sp. 1423905.2]OBJ51648.1 ABC transporter ATP-binding protein [Mycobacterium sp. 1423905.2]
MPNTSPLTVWVGSMRYLFTPGRDVVVGHGDHCDIRLDRPGQPAPMPQQAIPDVVLRFAGTHWVAIDRNDSGIFADGVRTSAVDIHDGQSISLGDPQHGPKLTFQLTPSGDEPVRPAPPAAGPVGPRTLPEPATQRIRIEPSTQKIPVEPPTQKIAVPPVNQPAGEPATQKIAAQGPLERGTRPMRIPPPTPTPPAAPVGGLPRRPVPPPSQRPTVESTPKSRNFVNLMTEATRKLRVTRPDSGPAEAPSTNRLPLQPGARTVGVAAYELTLTAGDHALVSSVSFTARPGSMIAVVGPSSARNSALLAVLAGTRPPTSGLLTVDGHDAVAEPETMRSRIGVVTRHDRVHRRLTVEQVLRYAAELRLPPNTSPDNRERVLSQVLDELELSPHRKTRVAKLPPEARRCTALAVELVTRPSLLVADEPSAGLDPPQDEQVMGVLRRQADLGCVVVIAMTSPHHLHLCDQVLLLTPAGTLAFAGPPAQLGPVLGTTDWSQIYAQVSADPHGAHHTFLMRQQAAASPTPPSVTTPERQPAALTLGRQLRWVARRQARLFVANRLYFLLMVLLPFALGALILLVPGESGFERPTAGSSNQHEAVELLAALNFGAVLLGTLLTIGAVVTERRIFRREQSIGLSATAYLTAKILFFAPVAALQAAVLTVIVILGKGGPRHGGAVLHNPDVELYISVAITAIVSVIVGLALSSLGRSLREVLPLLVPAVLASLLFAGGLVSLVGTWGYDQVSWFVPAQWGYAASAATVDLRRVDALATANALWTHYVGWWVFDLLMLVFFGALWAGLARYRLRSPVSDAPPAKALHREQQELSDLGG